MNAIEQFIASGIIELYVLGNATPEEALQVSAMVEMHPEVKEAVKTSELLLEEYSFTQARPVDPVIKPFLMAKLNYMDRLENGEKPASPPALHAGSLVSDYDEWLKRDDLLPKEPMGAVEARIIGATPELMTAIVWLKKGSPPETHTDEYESFLIVEGTCNIVVGGADHHLEPGDNFAIPLHVSHMVVVTSAQPCKVILQRRAA